MSDSEDYSSESDDEVKPKTVKKTNIKIPVVNKMAYDEDEDEDDVEDDVEDDDDDDDEKGLELVKKKINTIVGLEDEEEEDDEEDDDSEEELEEVDTKKPKVKSAPQVLPPVLFGADDGEEDEDDEYDEQYLQKFESDINKNYVNEFHPECISHNYDEIAKMSIIIRDDNGRIVDPFHKTIPFLTKYERARVLGQRAKQIETGSKPLVKVPENIIDGYLIADLELEQKKIPFIIRRPIPNGGSEYWRLSDLQIIAF
jgi:DNA-directed RNA polymerase subunit K/omega